MKDKRFFHTITLEKLKATQAPTRSLKHPAPDAKPLPSVKQSTDRFFSRGTIIALSAVASVTVIAMTYYNYKK